MKAVHLSRIDLNLFVVFDAIYTEGGITRAAKRLSLTQPAISHALGRLRELFDDPLFSRQGKAMIPTPLARVMLDPVRQSLQGFEATLKRVDRFDPATSHKHFTIGMRDVRELTALPKLLSTIARTAPFVDIATVRTERKQLEAELAAGILDAAIDVRLALSDEVRRERIDEERLVVVMRPRHPHVRRQLDLKTYLAQEHVLVSSRRRGFGIEDYELSRHGLKRRIRLRCQHYFAACRVVAETDLILTMAERYARIVNPLFGNRLMPFPLSAPDYDAYLYWHVNADADPANRWLRKQLAEAFRQRRGSKRREG
ncbi:MAG: LysR family transcriptional regulator [Proteobacteria bacterium]|nr:MAG: LysR family transcriptional regulator [Pseudomonadota bacterium]